jgi:hypothetical protein
LPKNVTHKGFTINRLYFWRSIGKLVAPLSSVQTVKKKLFLLYFYSRILKN